MNFCRLRLSEVFAAVLLLAWTPLLPAQGKPSDTYYSLSIQRGSLSSALEQFSIQTGLQYGSDLKSWDVVEREVGPIIGRFTPNEALEKLLIDVGLDFEWGDETTIRVYEANRSP